MNDLQYVDDLRRLYSDEIIKGLEEEYNSTLYNSVGEDKLRKKDGGIHPFNPCYVVHRGNGKYVLMGPFRSFVQGFIYGRKPVLDVEE